MLAYVASESPFPARPRAKALGRACSHASARMDGVEVWSSPLVCSLLKFPHLGEALEGGMEGERGPPAGEGCRGPEARATGAGA